jgi:hypothetical protein
MLHIGKKNPLFALFDFFSYSNIVTDPVQWQTKKCHLFLW